MPGIEVVRNRLVFPVFILIRFYPLLSLFIGMVNAYGRNHSYFYSQIILRSGVVDVSVLRG